MKKIQEDSGKQSTKRLKKNLILRNSGLFQLETSLKKEEQKDNGKLKCAPNKQAKGIDNSITAFSPFSQTSQHSGGSKFLSVAF